MKRQGDVSVKAIVAIVLAIVGVLVYVFSVQENPFTGERQRVAISPEEEVALGVQARDELADEFGGILAEHTVQDRTVDEVGATLAAALDDMRADDAEPSPYAFDFHVLADDRTLNALALPGGQIFITRGLTDKLQNRDQLAAVLAHEIAHVVHRHASQRMAKDQLKRRLAESVAIASESGESAAATALVAGLLELRYSREQELESDRWGLELMRTAGYRPEAMLELLEILSEAGGPNGPEFLQTHPHAENRQRAIRELLDREEV